MYKVEQIENFIFFDGKETFSVNGSFENSLPSTDYEIYSKSKVVFKDFKIDLFENRKKLTTFNFFAENEILEMGKVFNLVVKEDNDGYFDLAKKGYHNIFQIAENENLVVIFSLEGMQAKEYIYIHGLWQKNR